MAKKSPGYAVPALEKGLDVLEALSASGRARSLTELAQTLQRSPSELFRMLNCLESREYIRRDPESGCYGLTLKLYELAHTRSPEKQLLEAAARPMRDLTEEIEESCHLSVLSGGCQLVLSQTPSPKPLHLSLEAGARFPAVETASGRLLLAYLSDDDRANFEPWRKLKPGRQRVLRQQLKKITTQGFSSTPSEVAQGVFDLTVPVGDAKLGVMAALAVPLLSPPEGVRSTQGSIRAMQRCARRITAALGLSLRKG